MANERPADENSSASAENWLSVSLADAGFQADVAERLDEAVNNGRLENLHAVVVARRGKLALERYYEGPDERWGEPLGNGGQRLVIIPDLDLVVVVLAGNYNNPDAWKLSVTFMAEILLPALRDG